MLPISVQIVLLERSGGGGAGRVPPESFAVPHWLVCLMSQVCRFAFCLTHALEPPAQVWAWVVGVTQGPDSSCEGDLHELPAPAPPPPHPLQVPGKQPQAETLGLITVA